MLREQSLAGQGLHLRENAASKVGGGTGFTPNGRECCKESG